MIPYSPKHHGWSSLILIVFFMSIQVPLSAQNLFINEYMASNSTLKDEDGDASDWLEIVNLDTLEIDLLQFSLTDDPENPSQWSFPSCVIEKGSYVIVWASEKDRISGGHLHTNFKLSADGEFIGLYDRDGQVVDSITFGCQTADISCGRYPDGGSDFLYFDTPTPGASNRRNIALDFSLPEGVYPNAITLEMETNEPSAVIYYTINCDIPTKTSTVYTQPINITRNTVVRARIFLGDTPVTEVKSRTFIINDTPQLPVLFLVSERRNFWHAGTGIISNPLKTGSDWEKPLDISLVENGEPQFSVPGGIRIHGLTSRKYPKLNFRIYFRNEYGMRELEYPLFPQKPITHFKRLVLHSPECEHPAGNRYYTLIRDVFNATLWSQIGGNISAFKPVSLYLNGDYWGIYWIREYIDENYLESNLNVTDADLLRSVGSAQDPRVGDKVFWDETFNFISSHDLRIPENYQLVKEKYIDLDNFTDYHIINIFAGNRDWPHVNTDFYHDRAGSDTRWHWIMWDANYSWIWDATHPTLEFATRSEVRGDIRENDEKSWLWTTLFLRKLLQNEEYKSKFINRFCDLMNTLLTKDNLIRNFTLLADRIAPEMDREMDRWLVDGGRKWSQNLEYTKQIIEQRPEVQRQQILDYFNLAAPLCSIALKPSTGMGKVQINTVIPDALPWEGLYYKNIPIPVEAIPEPGFHFDHWTDPSLPDTSVITITFPSQSGEGSLELQAVFKADSSGEEIPDTANSLVVINEINYNSNMDFDAGDWVELHNFSESPVDISGWRFQDSDTTHIFYLPSGTVLGPDGYLVLCENTDKFRGQFPGVANKTGDVPFGLSGSGELIQIFNASGTLVDLVEYDDKSPWPVSPDGGGPTLELKDPLLDNSKPESWQASSGHGTPGTKNSSGEIIIVEKDSIVINEINYNSHTDFDVGDWVELYNFSGAPVDISGWKFQDSDTTNVFYLPSGTILEADGYLVLCEDTARFLGLFPGVANKTGDVLFGLSGGGEMIQLFNGAGTLVDGVEYDDSAPWPVAADGGGPTLELKDPLLDNTKPENWQASSGHGTPGKKNSSGEVIIVEKDSIVINEINYNSHADFDAGDWVELYNFSVAPVNISGWRFQDSDTAHVFYLPSGTVLDADGYLVLCEDAEKFQVRFPGVANKTGDIPFGLSGSGELIQIFNGEGSLVDSLEYDDKAPWPVAADGGGPTLELKDPLLDNIKPENWQASSGHGTPGKKNSSEEIKIVENDSIAVNEINYRSAPNFDAGDWIELYNYSKSPVDISGWYVQDSVDSHIFMIPANTTIEPDSFLVIVRNDSAFHACYPEVENYAGDMDFGLSGDYDMVRLRTDWGYLIDSVQFTNVLPWPVTPDGGGSTLELKDPLLDNAKPENWQASSGHGTPGKKNSSGGQVSVYRQEMVIPGQFILDQNYPNPFNLETTLSYTVPKQSSVEIRLFNIQGETIKRVFLTVEPGRHSIVWDSRDNEGHELPAGIYFCRVSGEDFSGIVRMLLIK